MIKQNNTSQETYKVGTKGLLQKSIRHAITSSALAVLALLIPCMLLANPIVVRINDRASGPPEIDVLGAPAGYNIYTGAGVNNFAIEDGALITLLGVDTQQSIPDKGGASSTPRPQTPLTLPRILSGSNTTSTSSAMALSELDSTATSQAAGTPRRLLTPCPART